MVMILVGMNGRVRVQLVAQDEAEEAAVWKVYGRLGPAIDQLRKAAAGKRKIRPMATETVNLAEALR